MNLFDHPIWPHLRPYASLDEGRANLDFLQLPDQLRELALGVVVNCVACGRPISPLRARAKSQRSRVAGSATERRLFYAPTCPTDVNVGCSRALAAREHKDWLVREIVKQCAAAPPATRVVNLSAEPYDVYIGRPGRGLDGPFGNPYRRGEVCARCGQLHATGESTLPCFEAYFLERVERDAVFRAQVLALRGQRLGCFCAPRPCHGSVIAKWLEVRA